MVLTGVISISDAFAEFPDPEKDPREYIVRYYTELEYQKWFDVNFPNETIEQKVGYPNKIITNEYYVNSLFDFSFRPPTNWNIEENPSVIGGNGVGIVSFIHPRSSDPYSEYSSSFIIHYWQESTDEIYYDDLLHYFSTMTEFPEQSQLKITDKSINQFADEVYQIRYDFNDVSLLPEETIDGKTYPSLNMALKNSIVLFLYPNGDVYELIFSSMPEYADSDIIEFNKSLKTFHVGKTEKLSDIIYNLNSQQKTTSSVEVKDPITSESIVMEPEPVVSLCGTGTVEKDGICVPDVSKTSTKESKSGGCLIATATYGSELAPQVQQLRELRDNSLLQTVLGTSFMSSFNDFYYSFSPTIADWERENPAFKEMVKITLTPMISSLSILNYVDMDSEVSVLGYGISLILLNVGMYFVAPAVVIHTIRKKF